MKPWGLAASIDIYDCDPELIRSKVHIKAFVFVLCDLIKMKRFGETQIVNFGEDARIAGYSMTQLIETSLISAHFANASNAMYLDIFSCKDFDVDEAADYAKEYFKGHKVIIQIKERK